VNDYNKGMLREEHTTEVSRLRHENKELRRENAGLALEVRLWKLHYDTAKTIAREFAMRRLLSGEELQQEVAERAISQNGELRARKEAG
jgi:hypothetical protein